MFQEESEEFGFESPKELVSQYEGLTRSGNSVYMEEGSYEQIIDFYKDSGVYHKAKEVAETATAQHPFSSRLFIKRAQVSLELDQLEDAKAFVERAKILDATDLDVYILMADIAVIEGRNKKALNYIDEAIKVADQLDLSDLYIEKSDIYEDSLDYLNSYRSLKKSLLINPKNTEALHRIWIAVDLSSQHEDNIKLQKLIIDKDPYSFLAWYNLGHSYLHLGLYEKAIQAYDYVMIINEEYEYAYLEIAEAYSKMGSYKSAIRYCEKSIELFGDSGSVYIKLGNIYKEEKDFTKSYKYYKKAIAVNSDSSEGYYGLATLLYQQGRYHDALFYAEKSTKINQYAPKNWTLLGDCLNQKNDLKTSFSSYEKAITLESDLKGTWIKLGLLSIGMDKVQDYLELVQHTMDPSNKAIAFLKYLEAGCYFHLGKQKKAVLMFEDLISRHKDEFKIVFEVFPEIMSESSMLNVLAKNNIKV